MIIFDYFGEITSEYGLQILVYVVLSVAALVSYIFESRDEADGE